MDIRVIDRSRHVTQVPTKAFTKGDDPFDVLDGLLKGQAIHTGQIELVCDPEFWDVLKLHEGERTDFTPTAEDDPTSAVAWYRGVRIFVTGEAKP